MPTRPQFIGHWLEHEFGEADHYPSDEERMAFWSSIGERLGLVKIGIHHLRVPPGRRISYPHAESAEEEFVFVLEGRLHEWWSPQVAQKFEKRAQCVRDQYSGYQVEPGVHIDGKLTAGENIADIGGLKEAYVAYQSYLKRHGDTQEIPQLTNDQLFFVAFAQNWCAMASPQYTRMQVTVDPHSPPRFRAIGAVSDNPYFAEAFSCKVGDPMVPKNQCVVW